MVLPGWYVYEGKIIRFHFVLGGLIFGVINIVGNFGSVFCDQAYWQSSVAAKPLQVRTYLLKVCLPYSTGGH